MVYQWLILQDGGLPLRADGDVAMDEHVCTATLVWPEDVSPSPNNSVVVDPSFSQTGLKSACNRLQQIGASWDDTGAFFETHSHGDHRLRIPGGWPLVNRRLRKAKQWSSLSEVTTRLPGVDIVACPGHSGNRKSDGYRRGSPHPATR